MGMVRTPAFYTREKYKFGPENVMVASVLTAWSL